MLARIGPRGCRHGNMILDRWSFKPRGPSIRKIAIINEEPRIDFAVN
jgi:hypothetical protein